MPFTVASHEHVERFRTRPPDDHRGSAVNDSLGRDQVARRAERRGHRRQHADPVEARSVVRHRFVDLDYGDVGTRG